MSVTERAAGLRREIERHRRLYYQENAPEISDAEYDALERELRDLEETHPGLRLPDSPTARVGGEPSSDLPPLAHRTPLLSLDNAYTEDELREWEARLRRVLGDEAEVSYVVEPKVDGLSLALRYRDGALEAAATRGDGRVGEDVTGNVRSLPTVPLRLARPVPFVEARAELFLPRPGFEALNRALAEAGKPTFANPRNAASGSIRLKDERKKSTLRHLDLFCYALAEVEGEPAPATHAEGLALLAGLGLKINPLNRACRDLDEVLAAIAALEERRASLDYVIDGAVVKLDRLDLRERAGSTSKFPRWAVAYKYPPEQRTTRVLGIRVQVGRTGALTPVAELEPVLLAGTTVTRATLHNEDEVRRKDVRVGDTVFVEKAGEIIPQVVQVVLSLRPEGTEPFRMPDRCPVCGSAVAREPDEAASRCTSATCPAQRREALLHFASRSGMDVQGLGDVLVDQLLERQLVRDVADLYALEPGPVAALPRMGEKSAENLRRQIDASRDRGPARLLFALGIRHVGVRAAQVLVSALGSVDALSGASEEELQAVPEVGPKTARAVRVFFDQEENRRLVERLAAAGVRMEARPEERTVGAPAAGGPLAGKAVVITGKFEGRTREELSAMIAARGGRVAGSVTGKTDLVFAGEDPGSKLEKARALGVRVVGPDEIEEWLA